ncbi:vanadium-dependent haloperoxidase [Hydrotalea sandarakina]|jgi:hypothetical protein|uniref:PAP2 superfamily protein n=1 Tax=Hydrotalea sandarakina TaxID=1004304 RepID=A0A2W7S9R1_9BACT|nr:vanadium-dependent haloperoxidase [Hydrotalea sandarakina]PZX63759.1 PAP2 superfamily protein [Hydrotalea sandarakina]
MKSTVKTFAVFVLAFVLFEGCKPKNAYEKITHDPLLFTQMQHELNYVIIYDIFTPPVASRVFAYSNLAAYEVLANEGKHFESLQGKIKDLNNIPVPTAEQKKALDYPLAATVAFLKVGKALTFSQDKMQHITDSVLDVVKQSGIPDNMYTNSVAYGSAVADSIMAWSKKDNYAQTRGARFTVTNLDGHWEPTPPGYFDAVEPKWGTIRTVVMDSVWQIKAPGPIVYSNKPGSPFYQMAKQVYETGIHLDTTQKWIANFWDCNSFKLHVQGHLMFATKAMTPCGHWMEIVGTIAKDKNADFYKTVYSYTGVALGIFDAFIASWNAKYTYDLVRPETFINKYIDPNWKPYLQTPPFPEYNSAHSTISSASAAVLKTIYGNETPFRDSSERNWGWPDRTFPTLDSAAREVSMSRFYGGIHYLPSVWDAYAQGKEIGLLVMSKLLKKYKE